MGGWVGNNTYDANNAPEKNDTIMDCTLPPICLFEKFLGRGKNGSVFPISQCRQGHVWRGH